MQKDIIIYKTESGKEPLTEWITSIKDNTTRARIRTRLARILAGNLGEHKYLSEGISEFKLDFGSGYRIYYSELNNIILLLLCGGDKKTQNKDIKKAIEYLNNHKEQNL